MSSNINKTIKYYSNQFMHKFMFYFQKQKWNYLIFIENMLNSPNLTTLKPFQSFKDNPKKLKLIYLTF